MERLKALAFGGLGLALVSCGSLPPPKPPAIVENLEPHLEVVEIPWERPWFAYPKSPGRIVARALAPPPMAPRPSTIAVSEVPSPLDLESWPFGWISDQETQKDLSLPDRFWTDQRTLWKQALATETEKRLQVWSLQQVVTFGSPEEKQRASWLLYRRLTEAGFPSEARFWLDQTGLLSVAPIVSLEQAWDDFFRLREPIRARQRWTSVRTPLPAESQAKASLLRQKLFAHSRPLGSGVDDYVSSVWQDGDDLWAATWNGAVVRWSLATDQSDVVLSSDQVAPIHFLTGSRWFVYAFQDQNLLRYSKVTGEWRTIPYPQGWTGLRVQGAVVEDDAVWVGYLGQGIWKWADDRWTLVDGGGGGPFINVLVSAGGREAFWVGTKDRGLWHWQAGVWTFFEGPTNVSVVVPHPGERRWLVGTWGEGTWLLEEETLTRWSLEPDYVTSAAWWGLEPIWGALDVGLVKGRGEARSVLDARAGIPPGAMTGLIVWEGRWIWGTSGQGWAWWSEHENPAVFR